MDGIHALTREPRLAVRRFMKPAYDVFTQRDGKSWPRYRRTLRVAPRYLTGLLLPGKHKTLRGIGNRMDLHEDQVRRFITHSPWDHGGLVEHLNRSVPGVFDGPGMLIVDDVGILKQGRESVGVQRQYSGAAGKISNCQVAVDLILAQPGKRSQDQLTWPLGMDLYVPQKWLEDDEFQARRRRVELPDSVGFQTKHDIAWQQIQRARDAGVPHCLVGGDSEYGDDASLRQRLREQGEPYIFGVGPKGMHFIPEHAALEDEPVRGRPRKRPRFDASIQARPAVDWVDEDAWQDVTWTEGTQGPSTALFQVHRVRTVDSTDRRYPSDEAGHLLLEQRGDEVRAYLCWGVDDWSIERLVLYAHLRWTIEQFHREAKQELALDQFEGRTWKGWNHHTAMVLLAYAFLATLRMQGKQDLPTIPAVVRVLVREIATQVAMEEGLPREQAKRIGERMVRKLTDWG